MRLPLRLVVLATSLLRSLLLAALVTSQPRSLLLVALLAALVTSPPRSLLRVALLAAPATSKSFRPFLKMCSR